MGLGILRGCIGTYTQNIIVQRPGEPDPKFFFIKRVWKTKKFTILEVLYPHCTNYEGKKILVYKGDIEEKLHSLKELDPHFSEQEFSPIARFSPNEEGLKLAFDSVDYLNIREQEEKK